MAVILLYHTVSESVVDPLLQVAPSTILRHRQWLDRLGYQIAPLSTVLAGSSPQIAAVTFDDGLSNIDSTVRSMLTSGIEPTVFVCPGLVGQENIWASQGRIRERLLDLDELKRLRDLGARFGVHGWNHRPFVGRSDAEIDNDLALCWNWFADSLGIRPEVFAWPFGRFDQAALAQVGLEFRHALTVQPGWGEEVSSLSIPRVVGDESMSFDEFADEVELKAFTLIDRPGPLDFRGCDRLQ